VSDETTESVRADLKRLRREVTRRLKRVEGLNLSADDRADLVEYARDLVEMLDGITRWLKTGEFPASVVALAEKYKDE